MTRTASKMAACNSNLSCEMKRMLSALLETIGYPVAKVAHLADGSVPPDMVGPAQGAIGAFLMVAAFRYVQGGTRSRWGEGGDFQYSIYRTVAEGNVWLTIMVAGGIHEAMDLRVGSPESTMFLGFVAYFESLMRSQ